MLAAARTAIGAAARTGSGEIMAPPGSELLDVGVIGRLWKSSFSESVLIRRLAPADGI